MNQYSELLYFIKGLAEAHPLVNTVTKGDPSKLDLEKANIYPLVHITIDTANFTNGQTILFDVTLACLNQRDINKEIKTDKFWDNDNEVDNHNETLSILNSLWLQMLRDWQERNITTTDNATLEKIEFEGGNILDGWSLSFQVELPNTTISLCDYATETVVNKSWDYQGILTVGESGEEPILVYGWIDGEGGMGSFLPNESNCTGIFYIGAAESLVINGVICYEININGTLFTDGIWNEYNQQTTFTCTENPFPAIGETCIVQFNEVEIEIILS